MIAIDAGHQGQGNFGQEPVGPGSSTMKTKVAAGTRGTTTGVPEYQLTLDVSLKLRDALEEKGYNISNFLYLYLIFGKKYIWGRRW